MFIRVQTLAIREKPALSEVEVVAEGRMKEDIGGAAMISSQPNPTPILKGDGDNKTKTPVFKVLSLHLCEMIGFIDVQIHWSNADITP